MINASEQEAGRIGDRIEFPRAFSLSEGFGMPGKYREQPAIIGMGHWIIGAQLNGALAFLLRTVPIPIEHLQGKRERGVRVAKLRIQLQGLASVVLGHGITFCGSASALSGS